MNNKLYNTLPNNYFTSKLNFASLVCFDYLWHRQSELLSKLHYTDWNIRLCYACFISRVHWPNDLLAEFIGRTKLYPCHIWYCPPSYSCLIALQPHSLPYPWKGYTLLWSSFSLWPSGPRTLVTIVKMASLTLVLVHFSANKPFQAFFIYSDDMRRA